jgi:TIR domain-containing protein
MFVFASHRLGPVSTGYSHDVFISHATEDKERFVRPLAEALRRRDVTVWYDEWQLAVGDRLVEKIDDGLSHSRFGVVVLSPAFFNKNWSRAELQAFAALEMRQGRSLLLPIWLDLGADDIAEYAPLLLGRVALHVAEGVEAVAEKLAAKVHGGSHDRRLQNAHATFKAVPVRNPARVATPYVRSPAHLGREGVRLQNGYRSQDAPSGRRVLELAA